MSKPQTTSLQIPSHSELSSFPAINPSFILGLRIVSPTIGVGVFNEGKTIPAGSFVLEYAGELKLAKDVLSDSSYLFDFRFGSSTQYCLDSTLPRPGESRVTTLRSSTTTESGSMITDHAKSLTHPPADNKEKLRLMLLGYGYGRYINHSKLEPNLVPQVVNAPSPQIPIARGLVSLGEKYPRLVFCAKKDIEPDEQLFFDYGGRSHAATKKFPWLMTS